MGKTLAFSVVAIVAVGAALVAAEYAATWLYYLSIKTMPEKVEPGMFLDLWRNLSDDPAYKRKLQGSAGIALATAVLIPLFVITELTRTQRALHGNARFANAGEIRAAGLNADKGILVGKFNGQFLTFGGQQFVMVAAPTRSGKGVGVVIPNCLNWPESLVVLDLKLENFTITSGFRAAHGQAVYLFNPFAEDFKTHRWNPLDGINRDPNFRIGDIQAIGATFYPSGASAVNNNEMFFNDQAQNLFMGLVLYLMETPELPCTLGEVLRQGSGDGRPVDKHLKTILAERTAGPRALSPPCIDALNRFTSNSDNTLASIKSSFDGPLLIFANPIVDAATSASDFDLRDIRRKRMSVYLGIQPNRLESASRLLNLFHAQLVNLNTDKLPEHDKSLKYQCLLMPDEFTAMGKISILTKSVAFLAGYGLRLLPIVQSIEQIEFTYGKEEARNFIKNHDIKIIFPPDDIKDAEEVSRTLGYLTEKVASTGQSRSFGTGNRANHSQSENISDQKRALLLPQEVRELPQTCEILLKTHTKPILCDKIYYYKEPVFMARLLPMIDVPQMDMDHHKAVSERRTRALMPDEIGSIDLGKLAIDKSAIAAFSGDPAKPSPEEAAAVVTSFFDQLGWKDDTSGDESNASAVGAAVTPPPVKFGTIDLSLLEHS